MSHNVTTHLVGHKLFKLIFDSDANKESFFPAIYVMSKETVQVFNYSKKTFSFQLLATWHHSIPTKFRVMRRAMDVNCIWLYIFYFGLHTGICTPHTGCAIISLASQSQHEIMEFTNPAAV